MRTDATPTSWDGFEYERVSALQRGVGLAFVDALDYTSVHRILDVGCGDGFLTEKIAERSGADVLGVDASTDMLARARERETDRLHFRAADVNTMVFDDRFDLIVSLNTLHWVPDLAGAFSRLFAAQAVGGRLACQLVGASDEPSIEDVAVETTRANGWREYFDPGFHPYVHPSESTLCRLAEDAGYQDVETSTWVERFGFPSDESFRRWCAAGMSVWTNHLPEDRRAAFIEEVTVRYTGSPARPSAAPAAQPGAGPEFRFSQLRVTAARPR
jgi:trans-aconitate 2-methyltransferase